MRIARNIHIRFKKTMGNEKVVTPGTPNAPKRHLVHTPSPSRPGGEKMK